MLFSAALKDDGDTCQLLLVVCTKHLVRGMLHEATYSFFFFLLHRIFAWSMLWQGEALILRAAECIGIGRRSKLSSAHPVFILLRLSADFLFPLGWLPWHLQAPTSLIKTHDCSRPRFWQESRRGPYTRA